MLLVVTMLDAGLVYTLDWPILNFRDRHWEGKKSDFGTSLARTQRGGGGGVGGLPQGLFLIDLWSPGAEVNATMIGENDPVDEVQGFLFGKLK